MNRRVVSELSQLKKREIPQRYGYIKKLSQIPKVYYLSANCSRKERDNNVKCVNCNESQSVNYRG